MSTRHVILNEQTRKGDETGAGIVRNRCAFTSRDMGASWSDAFTYAVVFGWDDDEVPADGAMDEQAERWQWDPALVGFLRDAHARFAALPDRSAREDT